jgi:hypothetical protein
VAPSASMEYRNLCSRPDSLPFYVRFSPVHRYIRQEPNEPRRRNRNPRDMVEGETSLKGADMNAVMTLNALALRRVSSSPVKVDDEMLNFWLERENACLTQSNARLRLQLKDLEASARAWIHLYKASLDRANAAVAECARLHEQLESR